METPDTSPARTLREVQMEYARAQARLGDIDYVIGSIFPKEKTALYSKMDQLNQEAQALKAQEPKAEQTPPVAEQN